MATRSTSATTHHSALDGGVLGNETFDRVEHVMREEGLTKTEAFRRISEETGRKRASVAANYYRVARRRGAVLEKRAPQRRRTAAAPTIGSAEAALARVKEALEDLTEVVRQLEGEIVELRERGEKIAELARVDR